MKNYVLNKYRGKIFNWKKNISVTHKWKRQTPTDKINVYPRLQPNFSLVVLSCVGHIENDVMYHLVSNHVLTNQKLAWVALPDTVKPLRDGAAVD